LCETERNEASRFFEDFDVGVRVAAAARSLDVAELEDGSTD